MGYFHLQITIHVNIPVPLFSTKTIGHIFIFAVQQQSLSMICQNYYKKQLKNNTGLMYRYFIHIRQNGSKYFNQEYLDLGVTIESNPIPDDQDTETNEDNSGTGLCSLALRKSFFYT